MTGCSFDLKPQSSVRFTDSKRSSFSTEEIQAPLSRPDEIEDLCTFVTQTRPRTEKEHQFRLGHSSEVLLGFEPSCHDIFAKFERKDLTAVLMAVTSRWKRLEIGLRFVLTLLSLATTPWLPKEISRSDIFVINSVGEQLNGEPSGPFFSYRPSAAPNPDMPVSKPWHAKFSLLLLKIVLLELFHGLPLDKQPAWAECVVEGSPNESTTFCSAFLWACRAEKELKSYFGGQLGGELQEAIRKCICYDFQKDSDWGDAKMAEVIYNEVVVPLEKCCPQVLAVA